MMAQRREVDPLEQVERLQQHRPLAPGTAAVDVDPSKGGADRRLDVDMEGGQVLHRRQPVVLLLKADDLRRDITAVEGVAGRLQPR